MHVNPLNAELNPICHLLALLESHHILHVSGLRVNLFCNSVKPSNNYELHVTEGSMDALRTN